MIHERSTNRRSDTRQLGADYPALNNLHLDNDDLEVLAHQGFLARDRRRERTYFKLRFRRDGRQRIAYVGGPDQACAVQSELDVLQSDVRQRRRLAALCRTAANSLREAKSTLTPLLEARGLHFHGRAIRRRRKRM